MVFIGNVTFLAGDRTGGRLYTYLLTSTEDIMAGKGKKDLPPTGDSFGPPDNTRRKFLETIAVLSGASLLYSIPAVRALAATSARIPTTNKIDIKLPATYAIRNEDVVLNITPSGVRRAVPVKFVANGSVKLTAAQGKNVANVEVISLSLVASDAPNLSGKTETITAHLAPGTRVGRLNLSTGELQAEGNLPVDVTLSPLGAGRGAPATGRAMTRYSSAKIAETPPLPNAKTSTSSKCVNNGDISTKLAVQGRQPASVSGALKLRMTPQA
jgi:hypothetical protein